METPLSTQTALVIDPDLACRGRMKQITRAVYRRVALSSTLTDALAFLNDAPSCDALYISCRYEMDIASRFVTRARELNAGKGGAYICVLNASNRRDDALAASLALSGFDASLVAPCSVEDILNVAARAERSKQRRDEERRSDGLELLCRSLAKEIDRIAAAARDGLPIERVLKASERFRTQLQALPLDARAEYFEKLAAIFEQCKPPAPAAKTPPPAKKQVQVRVIRSGF